jgi:hypothetical protein
MEYNPSWVTNGYPSSHEIPCILWTMITVLIIIDSYPKPNESSPHSHALSPQHPPTSRSIKWSPTSSSYAQDTVCISQMPCPSNYPRLDHPNILDEGVQIKKVLNTHFSQTSSVYFLTVTSANKFHTHSKQAFIP